MSLGIFRILQITDYDRIYSLWQATPGLGLSAADSLERIACFLNSGNGFGLVYELEQQIIGTILCGHDTRRGYLYHLAVALEYRHQGIGQELLTQALAELQKLGIDKSHVFVFNDNTKGIHFWTRRGWTQREDILVFSKDI